MATNHEEQAATATKEYRGELDVLDQLLKPEVQESLTVLVENLPKLAELTTILTKSYDFMNSVKSDSLLYDDLMGSVQGFTEPVKGKVKEYASAAIEANDHAKTQTDTIGLFGILRMLKDPQVQKMLHFAQAYLAVMAERDKQK